MEFLKAIQKKQQNDLKSDQPGQDKKVEVPVVAKVEPPVEVPVVAKVEPPVEPEKSDKEATDGKTAGKTVGKTAGKTESKGERTKPTRRRAVSALELGKAILESRFNVTGEASIQTYLTRNSKKRGPKKLMLSELEYLVMVFNQLTGEDK